MNILEVNNLTKKYGDFTAVNGVSFNVVQGEIFGFLGPNGAGKTTTINMLTGLARITSGSVNLLRLDYVHQIKKAQQIIGNVPDESNLYEELDGFENLCFCASLYGIKKQIREERAQSLLSGIDVVSARQIRELIKDLNRKGTTIFLTTHNIEEAEQLCHRVAFIVNGEIVRIGTTDELLKEAQQESIVQLTLASGVLELQHIIQKEFSSYAIEILNDSNIKVHSAKLINLTPFIRFFEENNLIVYEAKILRPSLEDVFVKVTGIEAEKMKREKEGGIK